MSKKSENDTTNSTFKTMFADARLISHSKYVQDPKEKRSLKTKTAKSSQR